MVIYQTKANLDRKLLCSKMTHLLEGKLDWECAWERVCMRARTSHSIPLHDSLAVSFTLISKGGDCFQLKFQC